MKYISLIAYCFISIISAFAVVSVLIPQEALLPTHNLKDGQVVYSKEKGTNIETGYRIQIYQPTVNVPRVAITDTEKEKPKRVVTTRAKTPDAKEETKEKPPVPKVTKTETEEALNPYIIKLSPTNQRLEGDLQIKP